MQSISNNPPGEVWVKDVGSNALQKRMFLDVCRFPNADIRGTKEQSAVLVGMNGQPELAFGFRELPAFHNVPYAVELVV